MKTQDPAPPVPGKRPEDDLAPEQGAGIPLGLVAFVFWLSGFAALLYQMVWQRALFTLYGTNIEAITVVVTAFMMGLGVGSLAGGAWSTKEGRPLLLVFAAIEAGVGLYGLISLRLFAAVGSLTLGASALQAFALSFALVLLPTLGMGATLPLLVAHWVGRVRSVGRAVSLLYFVNTLGAACGAIAAVLAVLGPLGLRDAVRLAAGLNLVVAATMLVAWATQRRRRTT